MVNQSVIANSKTRKDVRRCMGNQSIGLVICIGWSLKIFLWITDVQNKIRSLMKKLKSLYLKPFENLPKTMMSGEMSSLEHMPKWLAREAPTCNLQPTNFGHTIVSYVQVLYLDYSSANLKRTMYCIDWILWSLAQLYIRKLKAFKWAQYYEILLSSTLIGTGIGPWSVMFLDFFRLYQPICVSQV